MHLTDYTDYSLRALMYLGLHRERLVTIQDIADAHGISKNHLMKVIHQLGQAGLVETQRGRNGGLRLMNEPQDINLGHVVRITESDVTMVECFDLDNNSCKCLPACGLHDVLRGATDAYFKVLDSFTLAHLLQNDSRLRMLTPIQIHPRAER